MADAAPIPQLDFLTLGETLLRFSPPGMQRLDQAHQMEIGIGGSELNVACVLARLGRRTAWVSRLPEGPLGRLVNGEARRHGVDTGFVRWVAGARLGLMFFEPGPAPRNARVIYDRKHSAASEMGVEDAPWEALIANSARIHLSGVTPALGPSCRALVARVAQLGAAAGKPVSYDLNYRATLWEPAEARAMLGTIAPDVQLFIVAERDAQSVLGFDTAAEPLAEAIAARYGFPMIALTRPPGSDPGDLLWQRGQVFYAPRYPVEIVDRIGAGDSFVAGLIHGLLDGDAAFGIRLAAYAGAVALATPGDINFLATEDLEAFRADLTGRLLR